MSLQEVFGSRVTSLATLGVSPEDLSTMTAKSTAFLTSSGGVQKQVDFMLHQVGGPEWGGR